MNVCQIDGCGNIHEAKGFCKPHYRRLLKHGDPLGGASIGNARKYDPICSVDGCERKHSTRGYCSTHYYRLKKYGTTEKKPRTSKGICLIEGCERSVKAKGYCHSHYNNFYRTGNPSGNQLTVNLLCKIDGCSNKHKARGMCEMHYRQWRKENKSWTALEIYEKVKNCADRIEVVSRQLTYLFEKKNINKKIDEIILVQDELRGLTEKYQQLNQATFIKLKDEDIDDESIENTGELTT